VNAFEVDEEGAEPQIICTAEPDEYAWFNGLERDHMMPAQDTTVSGEFLECIEGASPRGVPEWECKKKTIEESVWEWENFTDGSSTVGRTLRSCSTDQESPISLLTEWSLVFPEQT